MATSGESSSAPPKPTNNKPVIVRVKRKATQELLDAFWLEINERPLKRPLLDFEKLAISDSYGNEELKAKKVFVQHVETVNTSEAAIDIIQSFVSNFADVLDGKTKSEERRRAFKKDNRQDQNLAKARQQQEVLAKNARFEQIWRSRKGNREQTHDKALREMCQFYDIVRVDVEERPNEVPKQEVTSLEDQRLLASYLPILREFLPTAAEEIESDIRDYMSKQDDFVYDYYSVNGDMNVDDKDALRLFPLVQVDDEEFYDGPDESEYDSEDSNAENNPQNDYPDEMSDGEVEEEVEEEEEEVEAEEIKESMASDESDGIESSSSASRDVGLFPEDEIYDDDFDNDDIYFNYYSGEVEDDDDGGDGDGKDWRWSYR